MIEYADGDVLKDQSEALVNTVNCVGVMGRGIALQFKNAYPENFRQYAGACKNGLVMPGKMNVFGTGNLIGVRWIINFPTKRHWRGASKIEDIASGLDDLVDVIRRLNIKSISLPPIGCGLGGLDWRDVRALIETKLSMLDDVLVRVHNPSNELHISVKNIKVPEMTPAIASYIWLIKGYLDGMLDPFVRLLELHKLAYFLQTAGEPLKLDFVKYTYGPYAQNLRHVLRRVEGHYISGYGVGGDTPEKPLFLIAGAIEDAERCLANRPETRQRIDRVLELVSGFESPNSLELMASVHYLMANEKLLDGDSLCAGIHSWTPQKRRFTRAQIERVVLTLKKNGFVPADCNAP